MKIFTKYTLASCSPSFEWDKDVSKTFAAALPENWSGTIVDVLKSKEMCSCHKMMAFEFSRDVDAAIVKRFAVWCLEQVKPLASDCRVTEAINQLSLGQELKSNKRVGAAVALAYSKALIWVNPETLLKKWQRRRGNSYFSSAALEAAMATLHATRPEETIFVSLLVRQAFKNLSCLYPDRLVGEIMNESIASAQVAQLLKMLEEQS